MRHCDTRSRAGCVVSTSHIHTARCSFCTPDNGMWTRQSYAALLGERTGNEWMATADNMTLTKRPVFQHYAEGQRGAIRLSSCNQCFPAGTRWDRRRGHTGAEQNYRTNLMCNCTGRDVSCRNCLPEKPFSAKKKKKKKNDKNLSAVCTEKKITHVEWRPKSCNLIYSAEWKRFGSPIVRDIWFMWPCSWSGVTVYPRPVLGVLGTRWEYTLLWKPEGKGNQRTWRKPTPTCKTLPRIIILEPCLKAQGSLVCSWDLKMHLNNLVRGECVC